MNSMICETPRLTIRKIVNDDFNDLLRILSDEKVMKYSIHGPHGKNGVKKFIDTTFDRYEKHGVAQWAVVLKDTGDCIGECGISVQVIDGKEEYELGYRFASAFWGKGYATEAAVACRDWAFKNLEADRLISIIEEDNIESIRVAEKVGLKFSRNSEFYGVPVKIFEIPKPVGDVAAMYDEYATVYDFKVKKSDYIGPSWLMENIDFRRFSKAVQVLDLGCATGINVRNIADKHKDLKATGLDISPKMIKEAEKSSVYSELFVHDLGNGLPMLESQKYDLVIALGCLEFVRSIDFLLDEVARVIKKNGLFYASFQVFDETDKYAPRSSKSGDVPHYAYSRKELETKLSERAFGLRKMERLTGYTGGYPCPYFMLIAEMQ